MNIKDIKEILKAFDESRSVFFELHDEGFQLKLKKADANGVKILPSNIPGHELYMPAPAETSSTTSKVLPDVNNEKLDVSNETPEERGETVKAPLVGVFYSCPTPDDPPFVQVGDRVKQGQVLCLIEAMKMMNEVKAPKDGVIRKIYAQNKDVIGFDDPLYLIGEV
ncbi:MAG: acetyl-CoA carboxylase biotin carboxyl carrier protein [Lachnospiraceae bacterium]|nr:acetyl-CoA carboxylase biotin carboxyl carrier protein [Lachnospiraceae bacterium]